MDAQFTKLSNAAVKALKNLSDHMHAAVDDEPDRGRQEALAGKAQQVLNEHDRLIKIIAHTKAIE